MTGIIIGRFQVPYLHLGHIYLISEALRECDRVVILLGTSTIRDERNPYSVEERKRAIGKIFGSVDTEVLWDVPGDDEVWSRRVDTIMEKYTQPILYHSRDSFKDHYKGTYPTREIPELPGYSGTEVRKSSSVSNDINVREILAKRIVKFPEDTANGMTDEAIRRNVIAVTKEIVETVVDKCGEHFIKCLSEQLDKTKPVSIKGSISQVKQMINYE